MRSLQVLKFLNFRLIIILFSIFTLALSRSQTHFNRGDSLSVERKSDFITSPDKTFTCGFHNLGTNANWFAIWFTNSMDKTVIWTANRDRPVNNRGSRVTIRRDRTMVLTDIDGSVIWQTNTSNSDVSKAELLETGNLVLRNSANQIRWQSFDSPTDTLLPSQVLTKNKRLISVLRYGSYESGYFNMYFNSENVLSMVSDNQDTSTAYFPNPDNTIYANGRTNYNSSRIAVLNDVGQFRSSDQWGFNSSDMGYGIKRRLTLDYDGNLRIYSLVNSAWKITWQAISQPCLIKGVCGKNTLCVYDPNPKCKCTPGFEVIDPNDWIKGCKAMFDQGLLTTQQVKFLEMPHTDYYGFDLNHTAPVSLKFCQSQCVEDPNCIAFMYRTGDCFTKSALFNGYVSPALQGSIHLKVPNNFQTSNQNTFHGSSSSSMCESKDNEMIMGSLSVYNFNHKKVRWEYLFWFVGGLGGTEMVFIILSWWFLVRKHRVPASVEAGYMMVSGQFRRYEYSELKKSTNNFKDELGKGSSGAVYKGVLSDNRIVAVKRLRGDFNQAQDEYLAEISTLGKINHMNVVRIWGYCMGKRYRMLVYEYLENLSLDVHLFGAKFLEWKQRYNVALGTAKGLAYLHHECLEWIIHCDVKPENILLDSEFQPKVADFGLAKLSNRGGTGSAFTRIRGTKGYMAPEWALNHPITAKVDVFGFGVMILEMVKGLRVHNWIVEVGDHHNEALLTNFVLSTKEKMRNGSSDWVDSIVDSRLKGKFSKRQATALIRMGICCVEEDRNKRPTMASVVQTLLENNDDFEI